MIVYEGGHTPFILYLFFMLGILLVGCGIEDYPYINPVPQSYVTQQLNSRATVNIPSSNSASFIQFAIFYKIYVSDVLEASTTQSNYSAINSTLNSDYNAISPYIDSDTLVNQNMDTLFSNRGYKRLDLNVTIASVLDSAVFGRSLVFDFSSNKNPTMTIGNTEYTLWRSNDGFSPRPNRLFRNSSDLWAPEYIDANINADVVNKSSMSSGNRYTYTAFFIVALGIDSGTYSYIYSTPALIHVFLLPDS